MSIKMKDASYGAVVVSNKGKVLLIKQIGLSHTYWSLPKGHKHDGEDDASAAIREVNEECGLNLTTANLKPNIWVTESFNYRGILHKDAWAKHHAYPDVRRRPVVNYEKTVYYALALTDGEPLPTPQMSEVAEAKWFTLEEATRCIRHEAQRDVILKLYENV